MEKHLGAKREYSKLISSLSFLCHVVVVDDDDVVCLFYGFSRHSLDLVPFGVRMLFTSDFFSIDAAF